MAVKSVRLTHEQDYGTQIHSKSGGKKAGLHSIRGVVDEGGRKWVNKVVNA